MSGISTQGSITVRSKGIIKLDGDFEEDMGLILDMITDFIRNHIKDGNPKWKELSKDTIRQRLAKPMSGARLKNIADLDFTKNSNNYRNKTMLTGRPKPLIDTGFLLEHVVEGRDIDSKGHSGRVWTGYDVAMFQDRGTKGHIPARPFYYLTPEEKAEIRDVLKGALFNRWTRKIN